MKLKPNYVRKSAKLIITDNRVKIPCDVLEIAAITICVIDDVIYPNIHFELYSGDINIKDISEHITNGNYPFYDVNGKFLKFKFETGEGKIYYYGMPVDDCGYPLIPDDALVRNAITWYIMLKWLGHGNKHPIFTYDTAEARWMRDYPRAQNSIKMITPEQMAIVARNWIQLVPRIDRHEDFFTEQQYHLNNFDNLNFDISEFTAPSIP